MLYRIVTGFFICLATGFCFAQSFTTINYSVPEGLPSSEVYEVYQDREGFVWFATDNGVVRFDGSEMQQFGMAQGLTDPVVFGFYEDTRGRMWFRTFSGKLSYYESGRIKKYKYNDQLTGVRSTGAVNFVYDAATDDLWFTIDNITGKIDSLGAVTKEVVESRGVYYEAVKNDYVLGLAKKGRNPVENIIINRKAYPVNDTDLHHGHRLPCAIHWNNKLYITVKKDIFEYDGVSVKKVFTGPDMIISLSKDKDNNLWIGYFHHGVQRYGSVDFRQAWSPEFLAKKSVTKVLHDNEGGLWFTTLEQGVFYVPNLQIQNFLLQTKGKVRAVIPAGHAFLLADEAGGVYAFDSLDKKLVQRKNFSLAVISMFSDRKSNIWISTTDNVFVFDPMLRRIQKSHKMNVSDFSEDAQGYVWGYGSNTMKRFDSAFNAAYRWGIVQNYRELHADDSLIFMGARIGLHIRNRKMDLISSPGEFSGMKISEFVKINDSTLLMTTIGSGFILLNNRNLTSKHFSTRGNFIADNVYTALKHQDMLWFATDKGVVQTDIRSLLSGDPLFDRLTRKSGLVSDKVNFLIYWNNAVWAFSDEGFSRIPRSLSRYANEKPHFYFKDITVNNRPAERSGEEDLEHNENNISITFGYKSFNNQVFFTRYRQKGERDWSYITHNNLQFTSLAPGTYDFELQYSADNIHWEQAPTLPVFVIHPPLWQTWYFQLFAGLLILAIIYWYFRDQVNTYRRHQQKLMQSEIEAIEKERSRIAKDLHDSVGTDFTAIKMVVNQILKKYNEPQTDEVEVQFQNTIQDVKSIIYGLSPPGLERYGLMVGLQNYVAKLNGKIPLTIEVNSFGPEVKDPKLSITVFRVIQELISNSLKHAEAKTISIHINAFADLLNVVYEDDGKGFSPEEHNKGLGLFNIESRLQAVSGHLRFDSGAFGISYTIDIPMV